MNQKPLAQAVADASQPVSTAAILLGYQQKWVADNSAVKVIEKSRRIGLSYAEAADDVLYAASDEGANVYYISYNKEMTQGLSRTAPAGPRHTRLLPARSRSP
ncbi:hypothetical protein [Marinobacter subterrani]|uniref:Uncharacterized protein n=1 Tax=Marinobacter subterrani TaxID=1658765 RepID=A0A0J7J722_9GAMM|nr:hypothetical protein [Marinobacter subterrani]KMQ73779.1 hypothetical protein Msub_21000 [Marinobacter subterrani]